MIRLLIAAPSPVVRAGLEALAVAVPGVELAGSFSDLSAVEDLRPDVVLADISQGDIMPPADGSPPAYVLLGGGSRPGWTHDALRLGVRAVLPPDSSPAGILAAIEAAASGLAAIDPRELDALIGAALPAPAPDETPPLTARERQVLSLMAEGAANKTIAWKLGISEHTVKFHVASILTKLNAASRTEAVAIGIRRGLVLL
jgi:DNA-binding NarL/FixJ family response regulator